MTKSISLLRLADALLLCGGVLLFALVIAFGRSGVGAAASVAAPTLEVTGTQQQLGKIAAGTALRTQLIITNSGGRRLVINEDSCGLCDADVLPTTIIASGETRRIELTWETAGLHGPLQLTRRFRTNDPMTPAFEVQAIADAVKEVPDPL